MELWKVCVLLAGFSCALAVAKTPATPPNIAGEDRVYSNSNPLFASFDISFLIFYYNGSLNASSTVTLPMPPSTQVNSTVKSSTVGSITTTTLVLRWNNETDFIVSLSFVKNKTGKSDQWWFSQCNLTLNFNNSMFENSVELGESTLSTNSSTKLFSRSFTTNDFYYCQSENSFNFTESDNASPYFNNATSHSQFYFKESVIFLGDFSNEDPSKRLCQQDYVLRQEKVVPIIVGSVLAVLLALIFVSYIISYAYRKRKERSTAGYEPVSGDD